MNKTQIVRCQNCGTQNRILVNSEKQAVCGKCKAELKFDASPVHITDANFGAEVENSKLPVLVDFWAAWCGPCRMIAPIIEQLAKEMAGKAKIGKLDVDQNPNISGRFRVQSIPTLIIFKNGKEVDRIVGGQSKEAIARRLQNFI